MRCFTSTSTEMETLAQQVGFLLLIIFCTQVQCQGHGSLGFPRIPFQGRANEPMNRHSYFWMPEYHKQQFISPNLAPAFAQNPFLFNPRFQDSIHPIILLAPPEKQNIGNPTSVGKNKAKNLENETDESSAKTIEFKNSERSVGFDGNKFTNAHHHPLPFGLLAQHNEKSIELDGRQDLSDSDEYFNPSQFPSILIFSANQDQLKPTKSYFPDWLNGRWNSLPDKAQFPESLIRLSDPEAVENNRKIGANNASPGEFFALMPSSSSSVLNQMNKEIKNERV